MVAVRVSEGAIAGGEGGAGAAAPRDIVVYAPGSGAHVAGSNVYPTFTEAFAAASVGPPRSRRVIQIDDADDVGNAVIPAGAYDFLERIQIWGPSILPSSQRPILTIEDGVTITGLATISRAIRIVNESTSPVITDGGEVAILVEAGATLECAAGAAPLIEIPAAGTFLLILREGSELSDGDPPNGQSIVDIDDGSAQLIVAMFGNVIVQDDIVEGPGVLVPFFGGSAPSFGAQANHTGTVVTVRAPSPANIGFVPGADADWVDPDPETAQAAIDRLAAHVNDVLLGGPIP